MVKKIILFFLLILLSTALISAQTISVTTNGVSPRDADKSSTDIFDLAYNGLTNVGIGTKIYLKGYSENGIGSAGWNITSKPNGSTASFGTASNIDANTQVIPFIPDVAGQYEFQFTVGTDFTAFTINAGTYLGYASEAPTCNDCHSDIVNKWLTTGHSDNLTRALKGTYSSHFQEFCIRCHSTGFDANASNNGFDDRDFVYPDSLSPESYDSLLVNSPEAIKLANVQCESCHGPGSEHKGLTGDSRMVSTIASENCALCHDSGTYHVYPEQWDISNHADLDRKETRSYCAACHNGQGFVDFVKGGKVGLSANLPENVNITCATCHDPHDGTNKHQLRTLTAELENGNSVTQGGLGILCMNCHKGRRDGVDYTTNYLDNLSPYYGPHHGPQADMLLADNIPTFGKTIATSNHIGAIENACVTCHMDPGNVDSEGNVLLMGAHSFRMSTLEGVDNIGVCTSCHPSYTTTFEDVSFSFNGTADLDGDGTEEGLQNEVKGLLDSIAVKLPPLNSTDISTIDSTWSPTQGTAYFNYKVVLEDKSLGIHNPAFTVGLLNVTLDELNQKDPVLSNFFYLGNNENNCAPCHSSTIDTWKNTGHATAQTSLSFLSYRCLKCHTTGWNPDVDNHGADEYVVEDTSETFGWKVTDQANFDRTTDIQCETCHGPVGQEDGSRAGGHSSVASVNADSEVCGVCHTDSHHPTYENWKESKHAVAKFTTIPGAFEWIASHPSCAGCHTAEGFIQFIEQDELEPHVVAPGPEGSDITCAACHDPHGNDIKANLRLPPDEICAKCHNPEFDPNAPEPDGSAVHHATAYMFEGNGGYEYIGWDYPSSVHTTVITDKCVVCHVFTTPYVGEPQEIPAFTGHTFEAQLGACEPCHAGITDFNYKNAQTEIENMLHQLKEKLDAASSNDSTSTNFFRAKFNYEFVESDGSKGVHNTKYARALLESAIANFNPSPTDVEKLDLLPTTYELSQNYPNPFNPTTQIRFSVPESGEVRVAIYDALGKEVEVLINSEMSAGVYNVDWNASKYASGIYFYRMTSKDFVSVKKMILMK